MATPGLGATLDLYDIEKPVVVLRMDRGTAQLLAGLDSVPQHIRDQLTMADRRLHSNLQLKAGQLRREADDLLKLSRTLREMR